MALVFAMMNLCNIFKFYIASVNSFFIIFIMPGIDNIDGMVEDTSMY